MPFQRINITHWEKSGKFIPIVLLVSTVLIKKFVNTQYWFKHQKLTTKRLFQQSGRIRYKCRASVLKNIPQKSLEGSVARNIKLLSIAQRKLKLPVSWQSVEKQGDVKTCSVADAILKKSF